MFTSTLKKIGVGTLMAALAVAAVAAPVAKADGGRGGEGRGEGRGFLRGEGIRHSFLGDDDFGRGFGSHRFGGYGLGGLVNPYNINPFIGVNPYIGGLGWGHMDD